MKTKLDTDPTNLERAQKIFPDARFDANSDSYEIDGYSIVWLESEDFEVQRYYLDNEVGWVTEDALYFGNFDQCLKFIQYNKGDL